MFDLESGRGLSGGYNIATSVRIYIYDGGGVLSWVACLARLEGEHIGTDNYRHGLSCGLILDFGTCRIMYVSLITEMWSYIVY